MRAVAAIALLLAAPDASAQSMDVTVPAWCTEEEAREQPGSFVRVTVRTDMDEVDVDGFPLAERPGGTLAHREFSGLVDLVPYLADRPLVDAVGDVTLRVIGVGRRGVAAAQAICRVHRTVLEVVDARLAALVGRANAWTAPYRPGGDPSPFVILGRDAIAWRNGGQHTAFPYEAWSQTFRLGELELLADEREERPVLERCPRCAIDEKPDRYPCHRRRVLTAIRVFEARTGRLAGQKTFVGPEPPPCSDGVLITDAGGRRVPDDEIFSWIRATF